MGLFKDVALIGGTGGLAAPFTTTGRNLLFGKKNELPGIDNFMTPQEVEENNIRLNLIRELEKQAIKPVDQGRIEEQVAGAKAKARAGFDDERRKLQQMVASRGLGSSSVGMNQEMGLQKRLNDRLQAIQASRYDLMDEKEQQRISNIRGALPGYQAGMRREKPTGRSGGLLGLATSLGGAALGYKAGGMQGASAGFGMGRGVGDVLSSGSMF